MGQRCGTVSYTHLIVIGTVIERHAAALLHGRFVQCDGVGEQGLVTVYGEPVGSGMKPVSYTHLNDFKLTAMTCEASEGITLVYSGFLD